MKNVNIYAMTTDEAIKTAIGVIMSAGAGTGFFYLFRRRTRAKVELDEANAIKTASEIFSTLIRELRVELSETKKELEETKKELSELKNKLHC